MSANDGYPRFMAEGAPDVLRTLGLCPSCGGDTFPVGSGYRCETCKKAEQLDADQFLEHYNEHAARAENRRQRRNRNGD